MNTQLIMNVTLVFDLNNAMDADDVVFPPSDYDAASWGHMILEDRHASVSFQREERDHYSIPRGLVAKHVMEDIESAVVDGSDMHPDSVY